MKTSGVIAEGLSVNVILFVFDWINRLSFSRNITKVVLVRIENIFSDLIDFLWIDAKMNRREAALVLGIR
jgi:hypothetical protein